MSANRDAPRAVIFGCKGLAPSDAERSFFRDCEPQGFILFARNIEAPDQVRRLTDSLRDIVGRDDAPILIDQEGGRVARLGPPHWRQPPPASAFGALYETDPASAVEAAWLNARMMALDLVSLGISVSCSPVLDLAIDGAHDVIGNRAFGIDVTTVSALGRAHGEGSIAGGVLPVIKHIPGHGRARVDSHVRLPIVDADRETILEQDAAPFRNLADFPWAMTGHIAYSAFDEHEPASQSSCILQDLVRDSIGFDGVLVSDDIAMRALAGSQADRAAKVLAAGCDLALHCTGDLSEMQEVADYVSSLTPAAVERIDRAATVVDNAVAPFDADYASARLTSLLAAS